MGTLEIMAVGVLAIAAAYAFWPRSSRPGAAPKDLVGLGLDHLDKRRREKDVETMKSVLDKLTGLASDPNPNPKS